MDLLNHPYINHKRHSHYPLTIFNYKKKVTYDRVPWDDEMRMARGLILSDDGEIVARPFDKFFNLYEQPETCPENLPEERPRIFEKMDGSLGIMYIWENQLHIATRGSFDSKEAVWATEWIRQRYTPDDFMQGYTYLFEIIKYRIVLEYDKEGLVLLAVRNNNDGHEIDHEREAKRLGLEYTPDLKAVTLGVIQKEIGTISGIEGYVLLYSNGLRVKIKTEEYVRLHRLLLGLTRKRVLAILATDGDFSFVPEESRVWLDEMIDEFQSAYRHVENGARQMRDSVMRLASRREIWEALVEMNEELASISIRMVDGKEYASLIWRYIAGLDKNKKEE